MRCLALAQAWDGPVRFVSLDPPGWLRDRLEHEGFELCEREDFAGASWILVDGYHFTADYLRALPSPGVYFDDLAAWNEYPVALVWNPGVGATDVYAPTPALLGPRFYPLRREFWPYRERPLEIPAKAERLLITMGGADPAGYTATALEAARRLDCELRVLLGGSNRARESLALRLLPGELVEPVEDMAPVLAWADLAVCAAGVTTYELAFLGVPTVLVTVAGNQEPNARGMAEARAAVNLGFCPPAERLSAELALLVGDRDRRGGLSSAARALVDGLGAQRVAARLKGD